MHLTMLIAHRWGEEGGVISDQKNCFRFFPVILRGKAMIFLEKLQMAFGRPANKTELKGDKYEENDENGRF